MQKLGAIVVKNRNFSFVKIINEWWEASALTSFLQNYSVILQFIFQSEFKVTHRNQTKMEASKLWNIYTFSSCNNFLVNDSNFKILINFLTSFFFKLGKKVDFGRTCITSNKKIITNVTGDLKKAVRFGYHVFKILEYFVSRSDVLNSKFGEKDWNFYFVCQWL